MATAEEQRAIEYRADQQRKLAAVARADARLTGGSSAAANLRTAWTPITDPQPEVPDVESRP